MAEKQKIMCHICGKLKETGRDIDFYEKENKITLWVCDDCEQANYEARRNNTIKFFKKGMI